MPERSQRRTFGMIEQPYVYRHRELTEPDWRRLPGWAGVTREEWESAQWQRAHCVKNARGSSRPSPAAR